MGFWRGRRVFVTGHTGFKGSWLCLWLQSLGAEVTGYALEPPTDPNHFELARVAEQMTSIIGDVRDADGLLRALKQTQPEVVLHLAAQSVVRASYDAPAETYSVNVMGTVHLLDAVRRVPGIRAVVNVTTDKVYRNREWVWGYREADRLGGHDPYSNSKACTELVTEAFCDSFFAPVDYPHHGVAIASARAGNVIGGGDWTAHQLVPDMIAAFAQSEPVLIRSPRATRPWQFVLEPLRGYLALAERLHEYGPVAGGGWNFGPADGDARPVLHLVETLAGLWGEGAAWRIDDRAHPHEAGQLRLDSSKARAELEWAPRLDLDTALSWSVDWYRHWLNGGDVREKTLQQIHGYDQRGGVQS